MAANSLESYSPLKVLGRGYSLTRKDGQGAPVSAAAQLCVGDVVHTRLAQGAFQAKVTSLQPKGEDGQA
jgi:exodeoxyribonuclease VII large subunit